MTRPLSCGALLLTLGCGDAHLRAEKVPAAEAAPAAEVHPGTIVFANMDDGTEQARPAADVPETIAWVAINGQQVPVVRVESRAMGENAREIKKFGPAGEMLESTIQVRRP